MSFQAPYSSSPPSTPDRKSSNPFNFGTNNPSTTPAGPPPSFANSFTPAGPPPTSFLGSSFAGGSIKPLSFAQSPSPNAFGVSDSSPSRNFFTSQNDFQGSAFGSKYHAPPRRGFHVPSNASDEDEDEGVEYQEEEEGNGEQSYDDEEPEEGGEYQDDQDMDDYPSDMNTSRAHPRGFGDSNALVPSREDFGARSFRFDESMAQSQSMRAKSNTYGQSAKDISSSMEPMRVTESDEIILNTEALLSGLYEEAVGATAMDDSSLLSALSVIPQELVKLWEDHDVNMTSYIERTTTIGPPAEASDFSKANFLAGITLRIHHPQLNRRSYNKELKPLQQTLMEWMDERHDPFGGQFQEVQSARPSPSSHSYFWETIKNGLVRGRVAAVHDILKTAGWQSAKIDSSESFGRSTTAGYHGTALANVQKVVTDATQVLTQCPAVRGDWNIRSNDWILFRRAAARALEDLRSFAEGREQFDQSSMQPGTYSESVQRAQSRVPWTIYQNLTSLYNIMIGNKDAILSFALDWLEASVGLLTWWDDEGELGRGRAQRVVSRGTDEEVFARKLRKSLVAATSQISSTYPKVDPLDPIQVGLASLLEGDIESVVTILQIWSGPLSSAVVEIGSIAEWLPRIEPQNLINMGSLDEEDFGVLGISSPSKSDNLKDKTLIAYARALPERGELKSSKGLGKVQVTREGWEIAVAILGRLDSAERSEQITGDLVKSFELDSSATVNKLWQTLNDVGMTTHAENIAQNYADNLAEVTHKYGEALWYYALSHKTTKVKDVLDLLVSYSLVQSVAYPVDAELDDHLRRFIEEPKDTLQELAKLDVDAAELLHKMLSGYATLRKFYTLRDEAVSLPAAGAPFKGAKAHKAEIISALMAVITSSDDNIRGGLYDEERGAVISVDFLLALLGEAMVFVSEPDTPIGVSDIEILLKAIEDIQCVGPRVFSACDEFLQTVIASGQGLKGSTPADLLRKSTSNLSGTSSFSMIGSSMIASQLKQSMSSSGVLVKGNVKRGWDWRNGISAGTTSADLLNILRLGLAKKLAQAWLMEADSLM